VAGTQIWGWRVLAAAAYQRKLKKRGFTVPRPAIA
jgi:hypothetical protein